ncbi:unnamed protein product [Lepeophtheirus salmonis]|uniref:(salmon louse) hypothetical protein n=1 Tax=Lepeophtheirus salmonis TaxID=72036 RepID=A0A7R8H6M3_LEPSM|nr:unnamed protein product [Lepeophtheirus salmonis]CAF2891764.1 unnamed protein product [Lepeophtheirus salmonis]
MSIKLKLEDRPTIQSFDNVDGDIPLNPYIDEEPKQKTYSYGVIEDQSLWLKFSPPLLGQIRFNPMFRGASIILIWVFVIICIMVDPDKLPFDDAKTWIVANFTWLYIGSQDIWAIFAIVLYFSKYSKIKLGRDDEKPEYNDATCRYYADRAMQDNELAQNAINVTLYHWGVHGWIVYCLVGNALGARFLSRRAPYDDEILLLSLDWRQNLWMDCLGLGTKQLKEGLEIVGGTGMEGYLAEVIIIWIVTAIATISTVSGVGMGIRRLSEVCFLLGVFLMVIALVQIKPMISM